MQLLTNTCQLCDHKWIARTENPKQCPNVACKRRDWNKKISKIGRKKYTCEKHDFSWFDSFTDPVKTCHLCNINTKTEWDEVAKEITELR